MSAEHALGADHHARESMLKEIMICFAYYSNQNKYFPALSSVPGALTPDLDEVQYKDFFLSWLTHDAEELTQEIHRCVYLGYALTSDEGVSAFAGAYARQLAAGQDFHDDLLPEPSERLPANRLPRLRQGIECFFITNIDQLQEQAEFYRSRIPILIGWRPDQPDPQGCFVVYLDCTVEYIPYPGKFPMTPAVIETIRKMAMIPHD